MFVPARWSVSDPQFRPLESFWVHDIYYLKNVKELYRDCVLLDDRGYLSTDYRLTCSRVNELCWKCPYDEIRTITSCNILYSDAVEKESKRFSRNFVTRL